MLALYNPRPDRSIALTAQPGAEGIQRCASVLRPCRAHAKLTACLPCCFAADSRLLCLKIVDHSTCSVNGVAGSLQMRLAFAAVCLLLVANGVEKTEGSAIDAVTSPLVEGKCGMSLAKGCDEAESQAQLGPGVLRVTDIDATAIA